MAAQSPRSSADETIHNPSGKLTLFVSNSSPLIYLAALSDFEMLRDLFATIITPPRVFYEVVQKGRGPVVESVRGAIAAGWIRVTDISQPAGVEELMRKSGMHRGESEAITLGRELKAHTLLLDDQAAVSYARDLGINVLRTPGIYRLAKQRGRIEAVKPKLDALLVAGFRLRMEHYQMILELAGEK